MPGLFAPLGVIYWKRRPGLTDRVEFPEQPVASGLVVERERRLYWHE